MGCNYLSLPLISPQIIADLLSVYIYLQFTISSVIGNKHIFKIATQMARTLRWRSIRHGGVSNRQPHLTIVYSTVYSGADQRKHQSSASLAFVRGNSPGTGEFPAQMASNAENISIWWRHHGSMTWSTHVVILCTFHVLVYACVLLVWRHDYYG